jgi:hypothetical protein
MKATINGSDSTVSAATTVNLTNTHFDSITSPLTVISALNIGLDSAVQ